jgi:hypothetical protein
VNWQDLRELRERGQRPVKLVVTTSWLRSAEQAAAGAMVVVHRSGEPFPVELLDGLDVELRLDDCAQATAVGRMLKGRAIQPSRVHTWCRCEDFSGAFWNPDCNTGDAIRAAWEGMCDRAA